MDVFKFFVTLVEKIKDDSMFVLLALYIFTPWAIERWLGIEWVPAISISMFVIAGTRLTYRWIKKRRRAVELKKLEDERRARGGPNSWMGN